MIVERIRRIRRRLRARKGESTHIDSRDDASQKANTSPRRTGVRADARVREPRFCTRARARLIKWSVTHVFPFFFLPCFFWVLGVGCSIKKRSTRITCVLCVYIQRGHSGKPHILKAPIPRLRRGAAEDSVVSRFAIFQSTSPKKWQNGRSRADVRRPRRLEGVSKAYKTERTHRRKCVCTYIVLKVSRLLHLPWSS